jgi:hypothetical protein
MVSFTFKMKRQQKITLSCASSSGCQIDRFVYDIRINVMAATDFNRELKGQSTSKILKVVCNSEDSSISAPTLLNGRGNFHHFS